MNRKQCAIVFLMCSYMFINSTNVKRELINIFSQSQQTYALVIAKKHFKLTVYNRSLKPIVSYNVGIGKNPDMKPKLHEGDNRTPEGLYRITEILSLQADHNSQAFKRLYRMNNVYFSAKNGFHKFNNPNIDLGNNVYGPRFFRINYPNKKDKKKHELALKQHTIPKIGIGSGIAIHGTNDNEAIGKLSSRGCIKMFNHDVIDLEKYITISTPVFILSE